MRRPTAVSLVFGWRSFDFSDLSRIKRHPTMAESPIDPSAEDPGNSDPEAEVRPRLLDRLPGGSPGLRTNTPQDSLPGLRVPKDKPRLATVSMELSDALTVLTGEIRKAEQFLRKQPGADRAQVSLNHVDLPTTSPAVLAFLETRRDERGNCKIVVAAYDTQTENCISTSELNDFPVPIRIELSKSIPELIELAVAAQSYVADDVLSVADAIEQTMARHRDNTI